VGFRIGLAIVVMLMIFATYNDILHLAAQWTASWRERASKTPGLYRRSI